MHNLFAALKKVWTKYKSQIFLIIALVISLLLLCKSCNVRIQERKIYDNNVIALTEEINTWKTKNGELVVEKTLLEGDYKLLKITNEDLYEQVKRLKERPKEVIYVKTEIENEVHDTTYIFSPDSLYIKRHFDFSNNWRKLTGHIEYDHPNLSLGIDNDITYADFTIAIKDSKVLITSNNPYIKYEDIQGIVLPKTKPKWSVGIGPHVGIGYGTINKKPDIYFGIGINVNYNLLSF